MTKIIDSNEWQDLKKHFDDIKNVQMRDLFKDDKSAYLLERKVSSYEHYHTQQFTSLQCLHI
jgi:hypothetical protein